MSPRHTGRTGIVSLIVLITLGTVTAALASGRTQAALKDLPQQFRDWLDKDVVYIISGKERAVFLQLKNDRERDIFIDAFWKQRDPTPGTPANEAEDEHYKRIAYANEYFSRDTSRPGWMTDRGRIYIVLGPPLDISRFEGESYVNPTLIWSYAGRPEYGLPSYFDLVFFRRNGIGEYVLYSPVQDGPSSLLVNFRGDPTNQSAAYAQLRKFNARLAEVSLSLIPGEGGTLGQPSLTSDALIGRVYGIPEKAVDARYAEALLKFKDIIEVDYTANYIDSDSLVSIIRDDSGIFFVHYAVQPAKLSALAHDGKASVNFALNGIVTNGEGRIIFQYDKTYPLDFDQAQIEDVRKTGILIEDAIPLASGHYTFSLLLKNTISKEFTSFEKQIVVPGTGSAEFGISPLLLGYRAKQLPAVPRQIKPFRVGDVQISCRPGRTFASRDVLAVFFQVFGLPEELRRSGRAELIFERSGRDFLRKEVRLTELQVMDVVQEFPLQTFPPDYYRLRVTVRDAQNRETVSTYADFEVSPLPEIPSPWTISKVMPPGDNAMYAYLVGGQLVKAGDLEDGGKLLARAYQANPNMLDYALAYAEQLVQKKDHQRAKAILSPFSGASDRKPEVLSLLGVCCQSLGQYREAVSFFSEYLSRVGANLNVLNSIGQCYYELGDHENARITWEKSLEIDPRQDLVKELLDKVKKKRAS
jgi:GWxTD domain-containing protein